jgi:aminotransferase EvaB
MLLINDLTRHAASVQDIVVPAVNRVVGSGWYIMGEECKRFEAEFAAFCGAGHCIGVANGTDALELALRALEMGAGSRVATVANAGFYSMTAMGAIGAEPVFIDVDPVDHLMDLTALREAVAAGQVDAIIVTHLYGLLHDMETVMEVAASGPRRVPVIEDVAQAHGASRGGKRAGSFGDVATFSFYPTKNLGAIGDGGAIVTKDAEIAGRAALLRQYGWEAKYKVARQGGRNSRLDEMQAAVLRAKLARLDGWNARRREIATQYSTQIGHSAVTVPPPRGAESVAHLYVVRTADRDGLRRHLSRCGVATDVHYPIPDTKQPAIAGRDWPALPETEALAAQAVTLPCFPEMTDEEVRHVGTSVNAWN